MGDVTPADMDEKPEPWPPVPPDVDIDTIEIENPPISSSLNGQIHRIKGSPSEIFKYGAMEREYDLQAAAGECAVKVRGRVMGKYPSGIDFRGFLMDLGTPILKPLPPSECRDLMHQMVSVVRKLHDKGIVHGDMKLENMLLDNQGKVRLCDFGEARYVDEDEAIWEGHSTWHYESPNRLVRGERLGQDPPPPIIEDDLYSLGLSIWELYTGKITFEDLRMDDMGLKEKQREGETVDVDEVHDPEAREIIIGLLRTGGARI
jgi:hypothetical protein